MKTSIHSSFLFAFFFILIAACSQNKSTNKSVEVNSRRNQTTTADNNNTPNSVDASSDTPTASNTGNEPVKVGRSGTKKKFTKN